MFFILLPNFALGVRQSDSMKYLKLKYLYAINKISLKESELDGLEILSRLLRQSYVASRARTVVVETFGD